MNERIKQLADQANGPNPFFGTLKNQMTLLGDDAVEKFAELIVRECVKVCESRVGNSDYNTGRMHCASDLKQHFGVE